MFLKIVIYKRFLKVLFPGEKLQKLEKEMVDFLKLMSIYMPHILLVMNGIKCKFHVLRTFLAEVTQNYKEVTLNFTKNLKNPPKCFGRNLVCVN